MAQITGSCGDNITFTLSNGILALSGTGEMYNYNDRSYKCPWYDERNEITEINIGSGITSVGEYTFRCCRNLRFAHIGNNVANIGMYSFDHCVSLRKVEGMNNVEHIARNSFEFCDLDSLELPETLVTIGAEAFRYNADLLRVYIPDSVTLIGVAAFIGMQRDFELVNDTPAVIDYCIHNSCHYCKVGEEGKERH